MKRDGKKNERISKEGALGWGRLPKGRWAEGWKILPKGRWAEGNVQSF